MPKKIQLETFSNDLKSDLITDYSECVVRNDRQSVFSLVRQLVKSQFEFSDNELTTRLWQEIAERGIDIERVIHLLYGCSFYDDEEMLEADLSYFERRSA